jgi:hypothetical protein
MLISICLSEPFRLHFKKGKIVKTQLQPRTARDLFPARTTKTVVRRSLPVANGMYQIASVTDGDSGSSALIWRPQDGPASVLKLDTSLSPLPKAIPKEHRSVLKKLLAEQFLAETPALSTADDKLWSHVHPELQKSIVEQLTDGAPNSLNDAVLAIAKACDGVLKTGNVPGTDHGNLACAWAVNEVVRRATGKTISTELLSTDSVYKALSAQKRGKLLPDGIYHSGCIIISPTAGEVIGHVGIVGDGNLVLSNSSSRAEFWHSYTVPTWLVHYAKLKTYFFDLDPAQFPLQ